MMMKHSEADHSHPIPEGLLEAMDHFVDESFKLGALEARRPGALVRGIPRRLSGGS